MPSYEDGQLRDMLIREEGIRRRPYIDTKGKITIGIGHNLSSKGLKDAIINRICAEDMAEAEADLDEHVPWWRGMSPSRQVALAGMSFQMGWPALSQFRNALDAMRQQQWDRAAAEMLDSQWARETPERAQRMAALIKDG